MENSRVVKIMRYYNRVGKNFHPPSLQVALTDRCFNQCGFCDHWKRTDKAQIDFSTWIGYLKVAQTMGLESVCYIGGDGMAYPHMNAVMEQHIHLGIEFSFVTTGYVPQSINMDLLTWARWIRVSLDAVTPEIYKKVRGGVPVEKVIASIDAMIQAGCKVELQPTFHDDNAMDHNNVLDFAESRGLEFAHISLAESDTAPVSSVLKLCIDKKVEHLPFDKCNAVFYQLYIDAHGDVYPCCHLAGDTKDFSFIKPLGDIYNWENLSEAINKFSQLSKHERPGRCDVCGDRFRSINHIVESVKKRKEFF